MSQFYTYLHCKPDGTPFYVGKGCSGANGYRRSHSLTSARSEYHRRVVLKYGKNNIRIFVFYCDSEKQALADEIHQIAQLRMDGVKLVNFTDGGEGTSGLKWTQEQRDRLSQYVKTKDHLRKISEARIGMAHSEESNRRISAAKMGCPSPRKGATLSAAQREKISLSWKTRTVTPETRAKQSASLTGRKHADSFESMATEEMIAQLTRDYADGFSLPSLEKKYRAGHRALRRILVANGVTIRPSQFKRKATAATS